MKYSQWVMALGLPMAAPQQVHNIQTSSGLLQGTAPLPNVHAYLGIPYAEPPVGDLRWAPPKPYSGGYSMQRQCFFSSPGCFQQSFITAFADRTTGTAESEDMLTINVWKPAKTPSSKLPVMVFIHGGGFTSGANGLLAYDGVELVGEQNDIILVTINYRVNIFGFPNTPALKTKNPGLLDQRLAVEWLRDNIGAFGGDAKRMTLSGHSAGSQSVAYYSFAYPKDPIVSALLEFSGQPGLVGTDDGSSWKAVAKTTGCANSDANAELACMRKVPARALKHALDPDNTPTLAAPGIGGGTPVVDNKTVFDLATYAARGKSGQFAKLPLMLSNTFAEGDGILPFSPTTGVNQSLSDLITLAEFHCLVAGTAASWAAQNVPTWRYLYNGTYAAGVPYSWMRPYHGSDLFLVFALEKRVAWEDPSPAFISAGKQIRKAVAAYVKDPKNGLAAPGLGWKRYNPQKNTLMLLFGNETAQISSISPAQYDAPCKALQQQQGGGS